ncbi:MAG: NUDIX hydrolase [Candidatus Pacebacteria bacterium CG10_big_fil_rev_8_21_14_0_10_42_12]|nr:MAG: NUDIX hydrolase [Candidatus Pacebacteria bacterium CG10_big_fil_rev_8_21_14_0_10_42_12]
MPHDDQAELFYRVDENDNVLGSVTRKEAHSDNTIIHRAVDIAITNSKNQILLQKRSMHKDTNPGFWSISASGHVTFGETYQQAAVRETEEELGVKVQLKFVTSDLIKLEREQEITGIFLGGLELTPTEFDTTEVSEVRWIDLEDLSEFIKKHDFSASPIQTLKILHFL